MDFERLYALVSSLWVVLFMVVFIGIVVWAFLPSKRQSFEDKGRIPLQDGE